jgi:Immunity protein 7
MYLYHCWVKIDHREYGRQWEEGQIEVDEYDKQLTEITDKLTKIIESNNGPLRNEFKVILGGNGLRTIHFSGLRNHYYSKPLEILEWIRENAPYSYGLLYIHNDEDAENEDNFVVYRLARQEIRKIKDNILSPCSEIIENGYFKD